jgi:DHA3 family macrolide efflux protein-like MFS transporter
MNSIRDKSKFYFMVIWFGEMISCIGGGISSFGIQIYVFKLTGTALSVSIAVLCAFLPQTLLGPLAGSLADRFDRRFMMIASNALAACALAMLLVVIHNGAPMWQIYTCIFLQSVSLSARDPAYKSTVSDLLSEDEYSRASGMVQFASSAQYLLSPFIAGILFAHFSISLLIIVDIFSYIFSIIATLYARKHIERKAAAHSGSSMLNELTDSWRYLRQKEGLLLLIMITSVCTFYIGFIQTLFTPLIISFSNSSVLGNIESSSAIGMVISSLILSFIKLRGNYIKITGRVLSATGITIILLGVTTNVWIIGIMGFLFFMTLPFLNTTTDVLVRCNVPNENQGKVWGMISILSQIGYIIAYAISGFLADYVFNPLLKEGGVLAGTLGRIFGVGPTRGIGLLFAVSGIFLIVLGICVFRNKRLYVLEKKRINAEKKLLEETPV